MSAVLQLTTHSLRLAQRQLFTTNRLLCKKLSRKGFIKSNLPAFVYYVLQPRPRITLKPTHISLDPVSSHAYASQKPVTPTTSTPFIHNKRFYSNQDSSSSSSGSSNGKWIFLALLLTGTGAAGIAHQYGLFDKSGPNAGGKVQEKKKSELFSAFLRQFRLTINNLPFRTSSPGCGRHSQRGAVSLNWRWHCQFRGIPIDQESRAKSEGSRHFK